MQYLRIITNIMYLPLEANMEKVLVVNFILLLVEDFTSFTSLASFVSFAQIKLNYFQIFFAILVEMKQL